MLYRRDKEPLPRSGIYAVILWLMVANVVIGAALVLLGGEVWEDPGIQSFGTWLAVLGGAAYFFFRWLGRREAARRREARGDSGRGGLGGNGEA